MSRRSASFRRRRSRIWRAARMSAPASVISASHNPYQDNGIKVFSGAGQKFTEELERQVEAIVADSSWHVDRHEAPPVAEVDRSEAYLAHLRDQLDDPGPLSGAKLVVDCANGATTPVAAAAFPQPRFRRHAARRFARWPEHQPALRIDASIGDGGSRVPSGCRRRRRVRRRRRPRDLRRRGRPHRGRRRRDAHVRAAARGRGPPARQHRRRDGDEQHRPGAGARANPASRCGARRWATST